MKGMPEKLTNYAIYKEDVGLLGSADVTLPSLELMSDTISGAGIAGEIESPVPGHYKSMELTIKWKTVTSEIVSLAAPVGHKLTLRASIQSHDPGEGKKIQSPFKVLVVATPKKLALGKFEVGKAQDAETAFEVSYIKVWLDGEEKIEIDKFNFISKIDGVDSLAEVRKNIGM